MSGFFGHGRLSRGAGLAVALFLTLCVGVWVGNQFSSLQDQKLRMSRLESLAQLGAGLRSSVFERLEILIENPRVGKLGVLSLHKFDSSMPRALRAILTNQDVEQVKNRGIAWVQGDLPQGAVLGFLMRSGNAIYFVQIDPSVFFSLLQNRIGTTTRYRAYILIHHGQALYHSQSGFMGADYSKTPLFQEYIEPLFRHVREDGVAESASLDRLKALASFTRLQDFPLALVLEDTTLMAQPELRDLLEKTWKHFLGEFLLAVAFVLGLAWLLIKYLPGFNQSTAEAKEPGTQLGLPEPLSKSTFAFDRARNELTLPSLESQMGLSKPKMIMRPVESTSDDLDNAINALSNDPIDLVGRFDVNAHHFRDLKLVTSMLTQTAARLSASPALYFRFDLVAQMAFLETDAGFDPGQAPAAMAFPLDHESVAKILEVHHKGKIASLAQYDPLAQVLLDRLGVAVFEAWAIPSGRPKTELLGVLVILQAGVQSSRNRDALIHIMRTTGNLYGSQFVHHLKSDSRAQFQTSREKLPRP